MSQCSCRGLILFILTIQSVHISGFELQESGPTLSLVRVNSSFRLTCRANSYYEWCTFYHTVSKCEFEWKRKPWNVTTSECEDFGDRISFQGDYNKFECAIKIESSVPEDTGEWSCVLEEYVRGKSRGAGGKVQGRMDVSVHSSPLSHVQSACIKTSLESCYKGTQPPCFSEAEILQPPTLGMVGNSSTGKVQDDPEKIDAGVNATLVESGKKSTQKEVKTTDIGGNSTIFDLTIPANATKAGLDYQAHLPSSGAIATLKTATTPSCGTNATFKTSTTPPSGTNATLITSTTPPSGTNATLKTSTTPSSGAIATLKTSTTPSSGTNATFKTSTTPSSGTNATLITSTTPPSADVLALRLASEANATVEEKANPSRYI